MWCSQWNQIYSLGPSQSVRMGQVACLTNMPRAGGECDAECQDARELKKKKKKKNSWKPNCGTQHANQCGRKPHMEPF